MNNTNIGQGRGIPIRPATSQQITKIKRLGYTGPVSLIYSYEEAARIIHRLDPPVLLTGWQRGLALLESGYTVEYSDDPGQEYCFRVGRPKPANNPDGATHCYYVCLDPTAPLPHCDCPDASRHDDAHVCKHQLACRVQVWLWAQESGEIDSFEEYLDTCGATALRAGAKENIPTAGEVALL